MKVQFVGVIGVEPMTSSTSRMRSQPTELNAQMNYSWEQLGSNQRLPSCKGGALNQLSYAPK